MIDISSKSNTHFRRWSDLATGRGIKKHQEFILMGEKLLHEFLKKPSYKVTAEILHEGLPSLTSTLSAQLGRVPVYKLPKALFNELDIIGTHFNLLVLECPDLPTLDVSQAPQGLEVVCPLGDPGNLGAVARSALAFGASKLILTNESCHPFHPKALKASAGALLQIPLCKAGSLKEFTAASEDIYALDMKGESVATFPWPRDLRLVLGEEGPGFGELRGLRRLSVPSSSVESLNATVAASIAMFCYSLRAGNQAR